MDWPKHSAVVIPCRNEGAAIAGLVQAVRALLPTVLVVDDGSTDDTGQQARAAGAEVISLDSSQGKGTALRLGWNRARELGFTWALCMDGDGQHAPADIPKFLQCAERTGASLVIGNRMSDASKMPFIRRCVNRWMSRRISAMAGRELPDSQCGFRLVRLSALAAMRLDATHFEIESEQLLAFIAAGERVEFVPVQVIYKSERSKIHPLRDTLRWLRWRKRWLGSAGTRPEKIGGDFKPAPR
jgi:glycosyltransferase involved in cell wall biosynthesis